MFTDGLFSAPAYKVYGNIIAKELYDQVRFTTALGLKDTGLMLAAGLAENVPLPSLNVYRDKLLAAMANGDANCDWAVMAQAPGTRRRPRQIGRFDSDQRRYRRDSAWWGKTLVTSASADSNDIQFVARAPRAATRTTSKRSRSNTTSSSTRASRTC